MLAFLRPQPTDGFAIAADVNERGGDLTVQLVVLGDADVRKRIDVAVRAFQRNRIAGPECRLRLGLKSHPRERDKEQHDPDVDDVAPVAAAVTGEQLHDRVRNRFAILTVTSAGAARELLNDCRRHKRPDADREQRTQVPHPCDEQNQQHEHTARHRHGELPPQIRQRCPTPGDERADPCEQEQHQTERDIHEVKGRRAIGDFDAAHPLGKNREQRPPEHRKSEPDEQQIIEKEGCFSAHH